MSKMYASVREVFYDKFEPIKNNLIPLDQVKHTQASKLNAEIDALEKAVAEKIGGLKLAVNLGEEAVKKESLHTKQVIETLKEKISMLERKLKEAEDINRRKESASQNMEENLNTKMHALQDELKKKRETLQNRDNQINNLMSNLDVLVGEVTELKLTIKETKAEAAREANDYKQLAESSNNKISTLQAEIRDLREIIRGKELIIKRLEENLITKSQESEKGLIDANTIEWKDWIPVAGQKVELKWIATGEDKSGLPTGPDNDVLRGKETSLSRRDTEMNDVKSQRQLTDLASFLKRAQAVGAVDQENGSTSATGEPISVLEEKSSGAELKGPVVRPNETDTAQQTVPPNFLDRMIHELDEIVGPLASTIVRHDVKALGESMEEFPKTRVTELIQIVSQDISDENLKIRFRERFMKHV
jgi:hypothetical protein